MDYRLLDLIATVIACCEPPPASGPGHPRSATVRVLATLRQFLREGSQWRSLRARIDQVSGSTLRRFLARWAETALLAKVHAMLLAMLRGNPTLILDSCSVRAKRGGDLTGIPLIGPRRGRNTISPWMAMARRWPAWRRLRTEVVPIPWTGIWVS